MAKGLKAIAEEIKHLNKKIDKLRQEQEEVTIRKALPALKKKYEGKYFKFDNGYNSANRWWMYSHVFKVINLGEGVMNTFEVTPNANKFNVNGDCCLDICQVEISRAEYEAALKKFTNEALNLY